MALPVDEDPLAGAHRDAGHYVDVLAELGYVGHGQGKAGDQDVVAVQVRDKAHGLAPPPLATDRDAPQI